MIPLDGSAQSDDQRVTHATMAATTGTDVKLAPGTIFRVRIDAPRDLT
ncbi:MAG: hypothetical protein IMZ71_02910 [Chloroflexi bacterium]|nr:hypothetical protein [Acidobacteriota bacterium]MBE3088050.1 hypothetical protein [Chloroflexota bacterium]MBE3088051.1 hypothetical protein [Chloroflexota bacterium]MBE3135562.1 hypothetical protein [Acidobacteriota bacterium]